jgi:ribosomal protein L29
MKTSEIRKFTKEELVNKYNEFTTEFAKIKVALKSGDITAENVNKSRELKKDIAKIQTVLSELKLVNQK